MGGATGPGGPSGIGQMFGGAGGVNQFGGATGIGRLFNAGMGDQAMSSAMDAGAPLTEGRDVVAFGGFSGNRHWHRSHQREGSGAF